MVSIVIVSHSKILAEGVKELADQMVRGRVPLAVAGGMDDPENPIGTNAVDVLGAIESVYGDDGVVVLMDLGSALMSAELAVEMLCPSQQAQVVLCEAPLVEGAMAAVVQADGNGTMAQVLAAARGALAAKASQLGVDLTEGIMDEVENTAVSVTTTHQITILVRNRNGLHARPAARFVKTANQFDAEIQIFKADQSANAKSINQVAMLDVKQGDEVHIRATGEDAEVALAAIQRLANNHFDDANEVEVTPTARTRADTIADAWTGIAASSGIAVGPVFQYRPQLPEIETRQVDDVDAEWVRVETAVSAAIEEIEALYQQALTQVGKKEAAIFQAHKMFLKDPDLFAQVQGILNRDKINAEAAWDQAIKAGVALFEQLADPYLKARAADLQDVGNRVLRNLLGVALPSLNVKKPIILVAEDLTPSDTAQLDRSMVLGICTELGGATSHSAILSRALGIPAIVGVGSQLAELPNGSMIVVDGSKGQLLPNPTAEQIEIFSAERDAWLNQMQAAKGVGQQPAVTLDGHRVEIAANISGLKDTAVALEYGADGFGLFRTEFLFLDRQTAPSEAEQLAAYREVVEVVEKRPLIIRTLDVGGDKPLSYLNLGEEENPFLGWRGIRFCLDKPEFFKPQLRAILRASVDDSGDPTNLKMMFPMIGSVDELRRANELVAKVKAELQDEGHKFDENMEVGIMIEVPAAVAVADLLARDVDFFSIGTNDLTQYVMAADRGNANVANLAQALQPAVLRMIKQTIDAAHAANIWVGMCGELAGNVLATPLLLGFGLDEFSMGGPAIPGVKTAVCQWTLPKAKEVAQKTLTLDTTDAVIEYLKSNKK
ncbi:MAG: phosphoenolpyruvate--protein phosphotransferase [Chloroflexi bacterium]|nr:MAG: phosphoenolpyruvate--protein phosphotransferase [Chloroflexota bacterium]